MTYLIDPITYIEDDDDVKNRMIYAKLFHERLLGYNIDVKFQAKK